MYLGNKKNNSLRVLKLITQDYSNDNSTPTKRMIKKSTSQHFNTLSSKKSRSCIRIWGTDFKGDNPKNPIKDRIYETVRDSSGNRVRKPIRRVNKVSDIEGATPRKLIRDTAIASFRLDVSGLNSKRQIKYTEEDKIKFLNNWTKSKENFIPKFIKDPMQIDDISCTRAKKRMTPLERYREKVEKSKRNDFYKINLKRLRKSSNTCSVSNMKPGVTIVEDGCLSRMSKSQTKISSYTQREGTSTLRGTSRRHTINSSRLKACKSYSVISRDFSKSCLTQTEPLSSSNGKAPSTFKSRISKNSKKYRKARARQRHFNFSEVKKKESN